MSYFDFLGYISILFFVFSFFLKKTVVKFHAINTIGCVCLGIYSFKIKLLPIVLFCFIMITFNLCNLIKHFRDKISFDILPIKPNEEICLFYYKKNKKTLDELFGTDAISEATNAAFIFRNNDIAGLIAYVIPETGTARLIIDFVSQKYRDCATGRYFFNQDVSFWHSQGIERLEIYAPSAKHIGYLEKIGFKQGNDPATWEKTI